MIKLLYIFALTMQHPLNCWTKQEIRFYLRELQKRSISVQMKVADFNSKRTWKSLSKNNEWKVPGNVLDKSWNFVSPEKWETFPLYSLVRAVLWREGGQNFMVPLPHWVTTHLCIPLRARGRLHLRQIYIDGHSVLDPICPSNVLSPLAQW